MQPVDLFGNRRVPTPIGSSLGRYAAGSKKYGAGRPMPNIGPVADKLGYAQRDNEVQARKQAVLRRLKGQGKGNPMALSVMGYLPGGVMR